VPCASWFATVVIKVATSRDFASELSCWSLWTLVVFVVLCSVVYGVGGLPTWTAAIADLDVPPARMSHNGGLTLRTYQRKAGGSIGSESQRGNDA